MSALSPAERARVVCVVCVLTADAMLLGALTFLGASLAPAHPHTLWVFSSLSLMTLASLALCRSHSPRAVFVSVLAALSLLASVETPRSLGAILGCVQAGHALFAVGLVILARRRTASGFSKWSSRTIFHHATAMGWVIHGGLRVSG